MLKLFENRMLRRTFGSKRVDVREEWIKVNNEELSDLYSSPNIFRVIKSRRMIWSVLVASVGTVEVHTGCLVGKRGERDYLEDSLVDGSVILSRIFKKLNGENGLH
jgi:hypothetical protein